MDILKVNIATLDAVAGQIASLSSETETTIAKLQTAERILRDMNLRQLRDVLNRLSAEKSRGLATGERASSLAKKLRVVSEKIIEREKNLIMADVATVDENHSGGASGQSSTISSPGAADTSAAFSIGKITNPCPPNPAPDNDQVETPPVIMATSNPRVGVLVGFKAAQITIVRKWFFVSSRRCIITYRVRRVSVIVSIVRKLTPVYRVVPPLWLQILC